LPAEEERIMSAKKRILFYGGRVATPSGVLENTDVLVEDGIVAEIGPRIKTDGAQTVDARGKTVSPGFIDIHVHGGVGVDTNEADTDGFVKLSAALCRHGVSAFLPTTLACPPEELRGIMDTVSRVMSAQSGGARILGLHLESNFISLQFKGAQPPESIFAPDSPQGRKILALLEEFPGLVKVMTIAPEVEGCLALIPKLRALGIAVSLGHSAADYTTAQAAFSAGATQVTHMFNAMPPLNHREPGLIGAALENDDVFTELICDGKHVHPSLLKTVARAKGIGRVVAVTDALRATGLGDGEFNFGGRGVKIHNGLARLANGTIAGSIATMDMAVKVLSSSGLELWQAVRMASATPADSIGLADAGRLQKGARADIVLLDTDFTPQLVMSAGSIVSGS
jgi:N-acetylglucosamine-6-phosphate deacetylase